MPWGNKQKPDQIKVATDWNFKEPHEKRYTCKNHMLEAINSMPNLDVNGSKDSIYNDFISFEDHFLNWDRHVILLTKWNWERKQKEPYVYIEPIGVFTDIGIFARRLQRILSEFEKISVMQIGDDLHIIGYPEKDNFERSTTYEAKLQHLDQIDDGYHNDGWKFDLPESHNQCKATPE